MKCKGRFVFKGYKKIDAGSFVTDDGEVKEYGESYKIQVDDFTEEGIKERFFKVAIDNTNALNVIVNLKPYDKIDIEFDLKLYNKGCSLTLVSISPVTK